jgi:hypothetical protein
VRLAALLESAVVVRAQSGRDGQFLPAQSRNTARAGERCDAGLGRGQPVAARAQELPERGAVLGHGITIGGARRACLVLAAFRMLVEDVFWLTGRPSPIVRRG